MKRLRRDGRHAGTNHGIGIRVNATHPRAGPSERVVRPLRPAYTADTVTSSSQIGAEPPAPPRARRWRRVLTSVLVVLGTFGLCELWFRYVHTPSPGLARFVFMHEMSVDRWDYIADEQSGADLESARREAVPSRKPGLRQVEAPETNRPPWDRLRQGYHVVTNADGFRDAPFPATKAPGVWRILLLGDSITWGKGLAVEERYGDVLRARAPKGVEILNLGHAACGTVCQVAYLREHLRLEPDLVVIQPSGNDVDHMLSRAAQGAGGGAAWLRWMMRSRAIQALAYGLFGDAKTGQIDEAVEATGRFYAKELGALFDVCQERGIPAVVLMFRSSNGARYGGHVAAMCAARSAVCLGTVELDLEHPARWLPDWESLPAAHRTEPPAWVVDTAERTRLKVDIVASLFPFRDLFLDIVHPSGVQNRMAAAQLEAFLSERWPRWSAASPGPSAPSKAPAAPPDPANGPTQP